MSPPNQQRGPQRGPRKEAGHHTASTADGSRAVRDKGTSEVGVPCRPGCSLSCPTADWAWVLDDRLPSTPAWRLAWSLHGLGRERPPVPTGEYRQLFAFVEVAYGLDVLVKGLRLAASMIPVHGSGVDVARIDGLARAFGLEVTA